MTIHRMRVTRTVNFAGEPRLKKGVIVTGYPMPEFDSRLWNVRHEGVAYWVEPKFLDRVE